MERQKIDYNDPDLLVACKLAECFARRGAPWSRHIRNCPGPITISGVSESSHPISSVTPDPVTIVAGRLQCPHMTESVETNWDEMDVLPDMVNELIERKEMLVRDWADVVVSSGPRLELNLGWFIFYNTEYYPAVGNEYEDGSFKPIYASSAAEALKVSDNEPGRGDEVFVVPFDLVTIFWGERS